MTTFNYLKRLGLHGGTLVWRVFTILVPVIGYSFFNMAKGALAASGEAPEAEKEYGVHLTGVPWDTNYAHTDWELYYGDPRK